MIDLAFHSLMLLLLGWLIRLNLTGPRSVLFSLSLFGAVGFGLAVALANSFSTLRLLTYLTFLHLPAALCFLGHRRLSPGGWRFALSWLAPGVLITCGIWAHWIEPLQLQVTTVTLKSPKITLPLRIAIVADLQTEGIGNYERSAIRRIMVQQPDIILFTGDYLQVSAIDLPRVTDEFREMLKQEGLSAPHGIYAVRGDVERDAWARQFAELPIKTFEHTTTFHVGELALTALSAVDSRFGLKTLPSTDRFHVVFGHAPDFALGDLSADLQIAGHTHGGQVRLPFFGPILTLSRVPRAWAAGVTDLGLGRTLIVSRGIGMERGPAPRLRFLCRPEIVIVHLRPAA